MDGALKDVAGVNPVFMDTRTKRLALTRITAIDPDATAFRLRTFLDAFTSPRQGDKHVDLSTAGAYPRRMGQGFCALLEHVDPEKLPAHGGDSTHVIVTISLDSLRKELVLRHGTCQAEGCERPGSWAEAHHWLSWAMGGRTDLSNAVLLCSLHHHHVHGPRFTAERLPNGDVRFTRRR